MDDKKFTPREIEILLHKVNIISTTPELEKRFRTKYATDFDLVNATIRESFIKDSAVHFIHQIVPTMFKIGNNVHHESGICKEIKHDYLFRVFPFLPFRFSA